MQRSELLKNKAFWLGFYLQNVRARTRVARGRAIPASRTDEKKSQSKALAFFVSKTDPSLLEREFK